jgi:tetratricopeptide (TPR) repeat protein
MRMIGYADDDAAPPPPPPSDSSSPTASSPPSTATPRPDAAEPPSSGDRTAGTPARDPVQAAIEQTHAPATRASGIATLARTWQQARDPAAARRALARALSWDGRLPEALAHFDALARDSSDTELRLERLQVTAWAGQTSAAEDGYRALLVEQPDNATALAGLARMQRWQGRTLAALGSARRAVERHGGDGASREELGLAYAALGLPDAARTATAPIEKPSAELARAIADADRVAVAVATTASSDSFGVDRLAPRAKLAWTVSPDVRVQIGAGSAHLRTQTEALDYGLAGVRIAKAMPRVEIGIGAAAYAGKHMLLGEASAGCVLHLHDTFRVVLGARRRPLLEPGDPLATDESAFFAAGSGATMPLAVARRGVDEARVSASLAPHRALYAYGDARAMKLSDGNRGYAVATGAGLDVLALAGASPRVGLVARLDSFATGFDHERPDYFSPARFHGELIAAQLKLALTPVVMSLHGGLNVRLGSSAAGWTVGGTLDLRVGSITLQARGERRDDLAYSSTRAWLAITSWL